jgi:type III secretion system YopN/LcrE/InvE/MxiC family regulator
MPKEAELRNLVKTLQGFEDLLDKSDKGGSGQVTVDDILSALQEFDGDVTHQFEALQVAHRYFEEVGTTSEFQGLLDEAQQIFNDPDIQRDVQAGYAIAKTASELAPSLETDPLALRESYREMLREEPSMGKLFNTISNYNLRMNFDEVISLFMTVASEDLASTSRSTDPAFLHALTTELGNLKEMKTVFEESGHLLNQTRSIDAKFANNPDSPGQTELTSRLLDFCSKSTVGLSDVNQILTGFDQSDERTVVTFATGLQNLHRLVSDRSFPSDSARLQQGQVLVSLISNLSEMEEQAYLNNQ